MNGKIVGGGIVASALIAGIALYYLQVFHYYERLDPSQVPVSVTDLTGAQVLLPATVTQAIDATSSPIRFRACGELDPNLDPAQFTPYPEAEPLTAPFWFDCFDATEIGAALEEGRATSYLSTAEVAHGADRVIAVFEDGRIYLWNQLNPEFSD